METVNPYATAEIDEELESAPSGPFADMSDKQVKKLYHRSLNVTAIGVLLCIGSFAIVTILLLRPEAIELKAFLLGLAIFDVAAAAGIFLRTVWGRILGIVVCIPAMINIPLGTIVGIMGLFAFIGAPQLFGTDRITHAEVKEEYKRRKNRTYSW